MLVDTLWRRIVLSLWCEQLCLCGLYMCVLLLSRRRNGAVPASLAGTCLMACATWDMSDSSFWLLILLRMCLQLQRQWTLKACVTTAEHRVLQVLLADPQQMQI